MMGPTMAQINLETQRTVSADMPRVAAFLRDYTQRPRILTNHFHDFAVEEGGQGAGTVFSYRLQTGRRERSYRMRVDEPTSGRTLRESDAGSSLVTTWTLTPGGEGRETRVVISSTWRGAEGVGGFFERRFAPAVLRRIYAQMLERLEGALRDTAAPTAGPRP